MTSKDNFSCDDAGMRNRNEDVAREKAALLPEEIEALSPQEIQQTIHELRVHQIQLEMQNEELRQMQTELDDARVRYFGLYNLAPVGYCTISETGFFLEINLTAATLLGMTRTNLERQPVSRFIIKKDQDIYYCHRKQLFETGEPQACELRMVKNDGTSFWGHMAATAHQDQDGALVCRVILSDITERKFLENERELTERLILLVSTSADFREHMSGLTASLQKWSGCEAVGIRLRSGDDYPYYETRGFPASFVRLESQLCTFDSDGNILRDGIGNPILECMCGNILCGRFDSSKPFFTTHGSFWTNSTTALLSGTTESDRQSHTLNRCNGEGYESVALIPLRNGKQVFGLIQFNDHRPGCFTPILIASFERMADSLAIALSRRQTEDALRESEEKFRSIFENTVEGFFQSTPEGRFINVNPAFAKMIGYESPEEFLSGIFDIAKQYYANPEDRHRYKQLLQKKGFVEHFEFKVQCKDGSHIWVSNSSRVIYDRDGKITRYEGNVTDITEQKRIEEKMQKSEMLHREAQRVAHIGHWELDSPSGTPVWSEEIFQIFGLDSKKSEPSFAAHANIIHDEDWDLLDRSIQELSTHGTPFDIEFRILRPNGETRWMHARGSANKGEDGNVARMFGTAQDITTKDRSCEERTTILSSG